MCGYVLVSSRVICLQVHESQSNNGPGSRDVSVHLIPLLHQTNQTSHSQVLLVRQQSSLLRALYFMSRVSLIPSPHPSFSTGESGNGDTGLAHQNKIAGCGRGVCGCGCHCLRSSVHVEAELVHQVEVGETRQGASQLE